MARHIADEGKHIEWVRNMSLPIIKATMSFTAKFFWTIVHTRLSLTQADYVVTWDRRIPQVDLPPLDADLADDVEKIQVDETAIPSTTTDAQGELHLRRAHEMEFAGASGSRSTIDVVPVVDEGIIDDVHVVNPEGSEKPDPPAS
uniref:Integrase core domain containing protein n=1 Tax=Solanum tuberosum TaxID=4113 RepID=M1DSG5_SOLTU